MERLRSRLSDEGSQFPGMSETYTTCPICDEVIDPNQPDAVPAEMVEDIPGFGVEANDMIWTPAGYAHQACLASARIYRPVAEPT